MTSSAFITTEHLTKRFGGFVALNDVSLEIEEGRTLALLGESGCGKTTMLRCIAGLEEPNEGRITIAGKTVFDAKARINLMPEHRHLGIVFQSYAVWPHMSVADNVGFPLKVRSVPKAELRTRVQRILDMVGLGDRTDHSASQLSGGQQQRVALARALIHEPRLVLFDEALSNLDAQLREQMRMELKVLQDRLGFTAIYVTHDQAEAFGLAERVIIMNKGWIETVGSPRELFWRPPTPFVAKFLGLNRLFGTVTRVGTDPRGQGAASGSQSYAEVDFGAAGSLWGRIESKSGVMPGEKVVTCVRKEHVGLKPAGPRSDAPKGAAADGLKGVVTASSFVGLADEYVVNVSGLELRAVQSSGGLPSGTPVDVMIDPDHCIVLRQDAAGQAATTGARAA